MADEKLLRPATRFFVLALAHMVSLFINLPASVEAQPSGTISETQLVQQLQPFPDNSKFVQILQIANLTAVLGPGESLYNKTIFAFDNAADVPRWAFNLTLVQCALNDPAHGEANAILSYNIIQGKFTFAQLQALAANGGVYSAQAFDGPYGRIIDSAFVKEIVSPDLVDDPTLSVHGVSSIDYFVYPGGPDGIDIACRAQADPCQGFFVSPCGNVDKGAACQNPQLGVAVCVCSPGFAGQPCAPVSGSAPPPTGDQGVCGSGTAAPFPTRCYFNNDPQGRYVCCDQAGCNGFLPPDNVFPHCANEGYAPPGYGVSSSGAPPPASNPPPASIPPPASNPPPVSGDQGVCGSGSAAGFPTRCYFNSDPQRRYVCCDQSGCNGFNPPDYSFPHCANNGFVPSGYGVSGGTAGPSPASPPAPAGDQGVCGSGLASSFPVRCWYDNDPQGRYVCCDNQGCDGFNPPDYVFPHCANNGYVPSSI